MVIMLLMLGLIFLLLLTPSLHGNYMHVWFIGLRGHSGEIAGKQNMRPLFLLIGFFCLVEILLNDSGV